MQVKTILTATLIGILLAMPATARDLIFGLSPNQSQEDLKAQVERALVFSAETLKPGETALFFDALNTRLIGEFVVPEGKAANTTRARLQANRALIAALKPFIDASEPVPGRIGQIDQPGFLRLLRRAYASDDAAVIVIGSPIHDDPRAPSVSMRGARVPNDGHVLATAGQSPFGTAGLPGSLEGMDLFFGVIGEDYAVSAAYAYHVERFWTILAEAHGAHLGYFGADLKTLFRMAEQDTSDRLHNDALVPTDKLEMLTFAPDDGTVPAIYQARPQETAAPAPIWQAAHAVTIGATWQENVDVDLYVRPSPSADVVYYGNADTPVGRLFKDVQARPGVAFETVALRGGTFDLSKMQIAVNYYGGDVSPFGVTGELRIAIGDQVWAQSFQIPATQGNKGAEANSVLVDRAVPNDAWVLIDPLDVLGVR